MNHTSTRFISFHFSLTFLGGLLFPVFVFAGVISDAMPLSHVLANILQFVLSIAGVVAIIGTVIAGFLYLTAAGDEEKISLAKKAFYGSVIGGFVVLSALIMVTQLTQFFS